MPLIEVGDFDVPAFLPGPRVERHEIVVGRFEEQVVAPHCRAAIADVRAAAGLPHVAPQLTPVAGIEGPDVIRRRHVEDAVHLKNGSLDARCAGKLLRADAAGDDRRAPTAAAAPETTGPAAGARRQPARPRQREVPHGGLVDLRQRAVSAARHVAGVGGPRIRQRLQHVGRIQPFLHGARGRGARRRRRPWRGLCRRRGRRWLHGAPLRRRGGLPLTDEQHRSHRQRRHENDLLECHFRVTRYAVTS